MHGICSSSQPTLNKIILSYTILLHGRFLQIFIIIAQGVQKVEVEGIVRVSFGVIGNSYWEITILFYL